MSYRRHYTTCALHAVGQSYVCKKYAFWLFFIYVNILLNINYSIIELQAYKGIMVQ